MTKKPNFLSQYLLQVGQIWRGRSSTILTISHPLSPSYQLERRRRYGKWKLSPPPSEKPRFTVVFISGEISFPRVMARSPFDFPLSSLCVPTGYICGQEKRGLHSLLIMVTRSLCMWDVLNVRSELPPDFISRGTYQCPMSDLEELSIVLV